MFWTLLGLKMCVFLSSYNFLYDMYVHDTRSAFAL